jgi:acyl carrier protein
MNQSEVLDQLQKLFNDIFLEEVTVTPELKAQDVKEWDSLMQISLMIAVEDAFSITFRIGQVEGTRNVGELANLILLRMQEKKS